MNDERGAVIEIVERRKKPETDSLGASVVVPNEVRINGQKLMLPLDEPITVHDISRDDLVKVTLTLVARRIFVGHEDLDAEVVDAVTAATNALDEAQRTFARNLATSTAAIETARQQLVDAHRGLLAATDGKPAVVDRLRELGLIPDGTAKTDEEAQP